MEWTYVQKDKQTLPKKGGNCKSFKESLNVDTSDNPFILQYKIEGKNMKYRVVQAKQILGHVTDSHCV